MLPLAGTDPRAVGRYRLVALLGEGGMGRVYLAIGPDGRRVALKRILPQFSRDPGFRRRFAMEVDAARKVAGPYTVRMVDADARSAEPWSATEFVPGPTLIQAVEEAGPLPEAYVRGIGMDLATALSGIHGAGLIHRDVKPSNMVLSASGAQLLDFGVSRAMDYSTSVAMTQTGGVIGSPGYMSPEQAESKDLTEKSDVFSLGCLLATAVSGRAPFEGPSIPQVLYKVVHAEPDLEGVPASLRETIERCLAKAPEERPSPLELRRLLEGSGSAATEPPAIVHAFAARQESAIAGLLAAPQRPTMMDTGPTMAYQAGTPVRGGQGLAGRTKAVIAGVAAAAVLLVVIPLWIGLAIGDDPASPGGNGDAAGQVDDEDAPASWPIPAEICEAVDVDGMLALLGPDSTLDSVEEDTEGGDDFAACSVMAIQDDLFARSLSVMVARNDRATGGDLVVCYLEGCDGVEPSVMPYGESTERPWTKGAIIENSVGNLQMAWYKDDLTVWVAPLADLDEGSDAERDYLLDQGIALYDFLIQD